MVVVLLKCISHAAYPLTSFEIQTHYQKEPKFNGVYSRDNLPRTKDGGLM